MADLMQQRRDTAANWASVNPVVPEGQLCFETDSNPWKLKVGNGTSHYANLEYITNTAAPTASSTKYVCTVNGSYTATKAGTIKITAVAGGGGGSSCLGCGGGSGQSVVDRSVEVLVGDTISYTIGAGGVGNVNYANDAALPSSGAAYAGGSGGDTVITIHHVLGGTTETITLSRGNGAICPSPTSVQYSPGLGENNGNSLAVNMYSTTGETAWNGGAGGGSPFGPGGNGGTITYGKYVKLDAGDALNYGAGGGGGSMYQLAGLPGQYSWTCGGDGMQGVVILEVL